jgi:hypothetical protein
VDEIVANDFGPIEPETHEDVKTMLDRLLN